MSNENEISKRFGYKNNSNLVIQTGQRNRENVPTGEAESLAGRIKYRMGDLADKRTSVKRPNKKATRDKHASNRITNENETYNILDMDVRRSTNTYRPGTLETKLAYDELLGVLTDIIGSQPMNIIDDIVFELLSILKSNEINEEEKRERLKDVLTEVTDDEYREIVDKSRRITDFNLNIDEGQEDDIKDSSEVAVVFDESESEDDKSDDLEGELDDGFDIEDTDGENEDYYYEENERESDNDLNYNEGNNDSGEFIHLINIEKNKNESTDDSDTIEINKLDAYWLQRELFSLFNDAEKSLEFEKEIISILEIEDDQECENSLVLLFNYEHFSWIKKLLKNRWNIYFCTILGQASSDKEKEKIVERMKNHPQGSIVLDLLSMPSVLKNKDSGFLKSIERFLANTDNTENVVKNPLLDMNSGSYMYSKKTRGKMLDLDRIYHDQNINTNLNTKVVLPDGTERIESADYDSIVIGPVTRRKRERIDIVSVSDLPEWCRECFSCVSITHLNEIQSKVYDVAFKEYEENMLVCAPTGSGKTNIAMLCILNVISQYITKQEEKSSLDISKFKMVYISPMKALVAEQVESLRIRLRPLGINVNEMTGDTRVSRSLMDSTQVFVTTPEKFDVITRKSTDGLSDKVKLIILDEVHMLHDNRGAVLEGIVARFKRSYVRMVGLSATLPNYMDVAEFLSVDPKKGLFHFGPEYRPVPLLQTFIGIKAKKGFKKLQLMNDLVLEKVLDDINKHQVLVFVHSRKDTLQTARYIRDKSTEKGKMELFFQGSNNVSREIILDEIVGIKSSNLKEILPSGIGIHHAGLVRSDRKIVEDLFSDGHIKVLVTTATLAWGVNLPAHTVIIKGTQIYQPERGEWSELSPLDMLQMIGRGGRPQYDNNGHGIIITDFDHLTYYLSLLNQQLNIESQLIPKLPDFINAEISLGNIKSKSDAFDWIKDTFLYIRLKKNPKLYGLEMDNSTSIDFNKELGDSDKFAENNDVLFKKSLDDYLLRLIETSIDRLEKCEMIQYDSRDGVIEPLFLGKISSHFYLTPETIHDINKQLLPNLSEIQLFRLFSTCKEFKFLIVRNEEKIELEKLVDKVPIPIQGVRTAVNNINNTENVNNTNAMIDLDSYTKANVLLQLYLTGSRWINAKLTLLSDLHYIVQSAPRIFRAIFHVSLYKRWSRLAKITLKIATMIERRTWEAMCPLRQFKGISSEVVKRLEKKDIHWNKYYDFTSSQLGDILKSSKLGPVLYNLIRKLPKVDIKGTVFPLDSKILQVNLIIKPDFIWDSKIHGQSISGDIMTEKMNTGETFWIFIEDCDGNYLYCSDMIIIRPSLHGKENGDGNVEIIMEEEYHISYQIFLDKNKIINTNVDDYDDNDVIPPLIFVRVMADRWLHSETCISISLERLLLPDKGQDCTELLDLKPMSLIKGFSENKYAISEYLKKMFNLNDINDNVKLNSIQTQLFNLIYNSDKSFYLSSPPGNGKFICTCIGILRELKIDSNFLSNNFKVLILECNHEKVDYIGSKLINIFGESNIGVLDENQNNGFIIDNKPIVLSDINSWDKISKKLSKTKEIIKSLKLLVINDLEYIFNNNDGYSGYVIESTISRLRYIITPLNLNIRIFANSKCISNAYEISEWLGISKENTFSFDQNVLNDNIDKKVIGFDSYYRSTRLQMMLKYIKEQILKLKIFNNKKETMIIFVLEYEFCLAVSNEISSFILESTLDQKNSNNYGTLLEKSNVSILLEKCISNGIGYLYKNQSRIEKEYVMNQYNSGGICILVVCEDMKNSISLKFNNVIVMDTKKIDQDDNMGSCLANFNNRTVEYTHLDIHQMMSRCYCNVNYNDTFNSRSSFTLLCSTNKQEFYEYILENTLPLESSIDDGIIDCINTEIALRTIRSKQDTIDWITWTFYYRRISKNPSYYGMAGNTNKHISDFLSEYLENLLNSLSDSKFIQIIENDQEDEYSEHNQEEDDDLNANDEIIPQNLCLISAFYNIKVSTIEFISKHMFTYNTYDSLITFLSLVPSVQENCIIRKGDINIMQQLGKDIGLNLNKNMNINETLTSKKIRILLNSYLKRHKWCFLKPMIKLDLNKIIKSIMNLIYPMVDVSSSLGCAETTLKIMELCQMLVQAIRDPVSDKLKQLSGVNSNEQIRILNEFGVVDIYDLINLEDESRTDLLCNKLSLSDEIINKIAKICNNFPVIETEYDLVQTANDEYPASDLKKRRIEEINNESAGKLFEFNVESEINVVVKIKRDFNPDESIENQIELRDLDYYPLEKKVEKWWVLVLEMSDNNINQNSSNEVDRNDVSFDKQHDRSRIVGIKMATFNHEENEVILKFHSSSDLNTITNYKLLLICDSFVGCDQEFCFSIKT